MSTVHQDIPVQDSFAPLHPPTRYLFGPGPTMVDPRVYQALSKPIVGHLDPYFIQVMQDVQELLKKPFGTKKAATLVISGTGSAGMEAAVANFAEPGAKFAVFANGYFSDRLTEMARRAGADVVRFEKAWGERIQMMKYRTSSVVRSRRWLAMSMLKLRRERCSRAVRSVTLLTKPELWSSRIASRHWVEFRWSSIRPGWTSHTVARKKG